MPYWNFVIRIEKEKEKTKRARGAGGVLLSHTKHCKTTQQVLAHMCREGMWNHCKKEESIEKKRKGKQVIFVDYSFFQFSLISVFPQRTLTTLALT